MTTEIERDGGGDEKEEEGEEEEDEKEQDYKRTRKFKENNWSAARFAISRAE